LPAEVGGPPPAAGPEALTSATRLARNSFLNLAGQALPLLAAVASIPFLVRGLGTDRFGVLTLAWMVVGYFSLFDLGLGRALTQVVAESLGEGNEEHAPPVVWTALGLMLLLGVVGAAAAALASRWLVYSVLNVPEALRPETLSAFYVLASVIPLLVVTAGLVGTLAAFQRFGVINAIRAPAALFTYVAPLAVLPFSQSLVPVAGVLAAGRGLAFAANFIACRDVLPPLRWDASLVGDRLRSLVRVGAWMTVSNVISPVLAYVDRFIVGAALSVAAVAYYATPYEVVTKLLVIPGALIGVLFPAFATTYRHDPKRTVTLFMRGTKYVALSLFPILFLVVAFAGEGLALWLGSEFALQSAPVLRILAIGVFVNAIAQVVFTMVQGTGRADLTAKLHAAELPIYLPALWWGIRELGIVGAALVWTVRVVIDGVLLLWALGRTLEGESRRLRSVAPPLALAVAVLASPLLLPSVMHRAVWAVAVLVGFAAVTWNGALAEDERAMIRARLGSSRGSPSRGGRP
jgi:O-antigen/teichoic acid export membrane protein